MSTWPVPTPKGGRSGSSSPGNGAGNAAHHSLDLSTGQFQVLSRTREILPGHRSRKKRWSGFHRSRMTGRAWAQSVPSGQGGGEGHALPSRSPDCPLGFPAEHESCSLPPARRPRPAATRGAPAAWRATVKWLAPRARRVCHRRAKTQPYKAYAGFAEKMAEDATASLRLQEVRRRSSTM